MINNNKLKIVFIVNNDKPEVLNFFQEKVKFNCPYQQEIKETKKYIDIECKFKFPSKKYSKEWIERQILLGNLCVEGEIFYGIDRKKKLIHHAIHKIYYTINFKLYDNDKNFRQMSIISIVHNICLYISHDMWNGMDKYYINRVPYLMLTDGIQYHENYQEQYPHITRYLFNDIMRMEISSYIYGFNY